MCLDPSLICALIIAIGVLHFSWDDAKVHFDKNQLKNISIAGIHLKKKSVYSKIDFADLIFSNESDDTIILNLEDSLKIDHTFPIIDRCCKLNGRNIIYDGIDNMKRINCDLSQKEFTEEYVNRREAIMMVGLVMDWVARISQKMGLRRVQQGFSHQD